MRTADLSADEGIRRVALSYLDQAARACERIDAAEETDPEGDTSLHDFRVGMRRLRSCMRAYPDWLGDEVSKKLRTRLKEIARATNPGRDAEVQLDWVEQLGATPSELEAAGVRWLRERLAGEMENSYGQVRARIGPRFRKLERRLRAGLSSYSVTFMVGQPDPRERFGEAAAAAMVKQCEVLTRDLRQVRATGDEALAHEARIHGKRLRYLIEPFRAESEGAKNVVKQLKALQDLLGDLNDLHNLRNTTGRAIEETALMRARELRAAAEEGRVEQALSSDERPGLLRVLGRVTQEGQTRFELLMTEWLPEGGRLDALERAVLDLVTTLRQEEDVEVERKYLLRDVPSLCHEAESVEMDQGYLPGERIVERVRRLRGSKGEVYVRTVKSGTGLRRVEIEEKVSAELFTHLWAMTDGRRVRKRRFKFRDGARTWEIDVFMDRELVLAEVELAREDEEAPFPDWLAPLVVRDVTDDPSYLNMNLAR